MRFEKDEASQAYLQTFRYGPVRRIVFTGDGVLSAFPVHLLRLRERGGAGEAMWLADRFAVSHAPTPAAWLALREEARPSQADEALWAMADPALKPDRTAPAVPPGPAPDASFAQLVGLGTALGDPGAVCELENRPATRKIADRIARRLGLAPETVLTGAAATESAVRAADASGALQNARIVAFNSHALVAGELTETTLDEPAIVLSPPYACGSPAPERTDPEDDGLLLASEVLDLTLDADWVLLTACNTAASDGTPDGEPLSGLASSFFYAGARALLVSHWEASVAADVAADGPTEIFMNALFAPEAADLPRAEAVRLAYSAVRRYYPHPSHWATFSVIGD
jgi:CHAT domain-containing protein